MLAQQLQNTHDSNGQNFDTSRMFCQVKMFNSGHPVVYAIKPSHLRLLVVCWLVCLQDYTKTTKQISTKLLWRMGLSQE